MDAGGGENSFDIICFLLQFWLYCCRCMYICTSHGAFEFTRYIGIECVHIYCELSFTQLSKSLCANLRYVSLFLSIAIKLLFISVAVNTLS